MILVGLLVSALGGFNTVIEWDFQEEAAVRDWRPNAYLDDVTHRDGVLAARAIDWDPFFICGDLDIPATSDQFVLLRIKADVAGTGQLFWTGAEDGPHGGFDGAKVTDFFVRDGDDFQDVHIFPFWHREGVIRQLRLDVYDGARFEISRIAVLERSAPVSLSGDNLVWELGENLEKSGWQSLNQGRLLVGPALDVDCDAVGWASFRVRSETDEAFVLEWSTASMLGARQENIYVHGDDRVRDYHVELQGHPQWEGRLVGLNILGPDGTQARVERVALSPAPDGPPEAQLLHFGFENGMNRAGRAEKVLAQIVNRGGGTLVLEDLSLHTAAGLGLLGEMERDGSPQLGHGEILELRWTVQAERPEAYTVGLDWDGARQRVEAELLFLPPLSLAVDYVPVPRPIETRRHILAYYFPGWDADVKWECIRYGFPERKPLLGYYNETLTECVDWQIKWAVENGIRAFLVDWYWVDGAQSLLHWFEAYRQARYRDLLEVAIMWANHNPPDTHSREDWRNVTREWIDRYFTLDGYYRINGKPAVFIWDGSALRNDLGGSAEVAAALAESQQMARDAGHEGIEFVILQHHVNESDVNRYLEEGYAGHTSYHEWGNAPSLAPVPSRGRYADIVAGAPEAWRRKGQFSDRLAYYPVVDTGWDSRPWHGANARAFHGRDAAGFKTLLEEVERYCVAHDNPIVILGPLNEWGEGSYIEPNLEFGFDMYEAVRATFGLGAPDDWPQNLGPRDVGLGPYAFPAAPASLTWSFDTGLEGWSAMMGIAGLAVEDGIMRFESASPDPALLVSTRGLNAAEYPKLHIRMKVTGPLSEQPQAQIFWAIGDAAKTEATSLRFPLEKDGLFHDYILDLASHPRWRGRIASLRFDPCEFRGATLHIDSVAFIASADQ